jgi:hypothetical protein
VVPAARAHLAEARGDAVAAGAATPRHHAVATVHALVSHTLAGRATRRYAAVAGRLPGAYAVLERELPASVVERLPERVHQVGPRGLTTLVAAAAGGLMVWAGAAAGVLPG